ncbi:DUF6498-containing protein [archaeon]|nr:DUF6498-containing protein [archaeon]
MPIRTLKTMLFPHVGLTELKKVITYPSGIVLILANIIVLLGVIFSGWNALTVITLYWAEIGIVGFYTMIKMEMAKKIQNPAEHFFPTMTPRFLKEHFFTAKLLALLFFLIYFGILMLAYISLIFAIFLPTLALPNTPGHLLPHYINQIMNIALLEGVYIGLAVLFISHGVSFATNFIGRKEYEHESLIAGATSPLPRLIVVHIILLLGIAIVVYWKGDILLPLTLVVIGKTVLDLLGHANERKLFETI